jgi:hypothetical protein
MTLTRTQIRKRLAKHRGALSELARELKVSRVTVHQVLAGRSRSERILSAAIEKLRVMEGEKAA